MSTRVIYLAGPMRGVAQFNFPAFREARETLRGAGHIVMCPAERDEQQGFAAGDYDGTEDLARIGFSLTEALWDCFTAVLNADWVVLLPGWEKSTGARAEALVGVMTGCTLYEYTPGAPWTMVRIQPEIVTHVASVVTR